MIILKEKLKQKDKWSDQAKQNKIAIDSIIFMFMFIKIEDRIIIDNCIDERENQGCIYLKITSHKILVFQFLAACVH